MIRYDHNFFVIINFVDLLKILITFLNHRSIIVIEQYIWYKRLEIT